MKVISITNRSLCSGDFLTRIERICRAGADYVVLREKDLGEEEYTDLAKKCLEISKEKLIINSRVKVAKALGINKIQLSFADFLEYGRGGFEKVGVSVHSLQEAKTAEAAGADFLIAGHIFETDCKKGVLPRGVDFIKEIEKGVSIPVFAIGGINLRTAPLLKDSGIFGVCLMSGLMTGDNIEEVIDGIKTNLN